ncbi:MAG: hypothetical protein QOE54_4978 [Streptosporangiaceae bacterium]|nr:hypothetical protein [Streptosporangiaceae bacterium]
MLEPQSALVFLLLLSLYALATRWLDTTERGWIKGLTGALALVPAMLLGMAGLNCYYGYYQDWGSLIRDLTGSADPGVHMLRDATPEVPLKRAFQPVLDAAVHNSATAVDGLRVLIRIHGDTSGLTRKVILYLPPQYFQPAYSGTPFPVVELLHGAPGDPRDWIDRLHVTEVLSRQVAVGTATASVLVIPDTNGGTDSSLQCLNTVNGPQDESFLVQDLGTQISKALRVYPPGSHWALAGFSEGGYCSANLALRHPDRFGAAAVMSGYFVPQRWVRLPGRADPFDGDQYLREDNAPLDLLRRSSGPATIPRMWIMTGSARADDTHAAQQFMAVLRPHRPDAQLIQVRGGTHTFPAWRQALPAMLDWVTKTTGSSADPAPHAGRQGVNGAQSRSRAPARSSSPARPPTWRPCTGCSRFAATN